MNIRSDELAEFKPPVEAKDSTEVRELPVAFIESQTVPAKIGPYLDTVRTKFLDRNSQNMFVLKNALYSPNLPLGNSLLFLNVPGDVVTQNTGRQIRDFYLAEEQKQMESLAHLNQRQDFLEAGQARIEKMIATPDVFAVNNYGDVTAHDGSEGEGTRGTLVKYQWHMPMIVLGLAAGERAGLSFTITIRDKAFNFDTVSRHSAMTA